MPDDPMMFTPETTTEQDSRRRLLRYKTATARSVVAKHPEHFGKTEQVILLLAYRSIFKKYAADRLAVNRKNVVEQIEADGQRFARECAIEMTHAGIDLERATELGRLVALEDDAFELGVREAAATGKSTEIVKA